MICGAADEGSAALFVCGGEGRIWLRRRGTCRTDGRGGIGGRMMTCGRRWIEEPRLFDRKSDDFPSQSLLTSGLDGRPSSSPHCLPRVHHPHAADANAPVCAAGATTPEPDPGVEGREEWSGSARRADRREIVAWKGRVCWRTGGGAGSAWRADRREIVVCGRGESVGGRGEGLDSPGGRIGVSLLTGAKFGDRMKKIFPEFFVLDFMRTEKFREHIV